jgi:hypothetical protein
MSEDYHQELIKAVDSLQRAMGESIFRTEKLKTLATRDGKIVYGFEKEIDELLKTLTQISQLYRHEIAEKIKSFTPKN